MRRGRKHQEMKRLPLYDFHFSDFLGIITEKSCLHDLAYYVDYEALREPLMVPEHLGGLPRGIRGNISKCSGY